MTMQTMFHVTERENVDSIQSEGLLADDTMNKVFMMDDAEKAHEYGKLMPVIDDPTVLEVKVLEHKLTHDDEEPGEEFREHAFYVRGDISAHRIDGVVSDE